MLIKNIMPRLQVTCMDSSYQGGKEKLNIRKKIEVTQAKKRTDLKINQYKSQQICYVEAVPETSKNITFVLLAGVKQKICNCGPR